MDTENEKAPRPVAVPAHLGWRLLALTYDALPMIPLLFIISGLFVWMTGGRAVEGRPMLQWLELAASWLLVGAYFVLSWRRGGQTMGMRPWRLRVVSSDGNQPAMRTLWLRYLVATATFGAGMLWALFDRERRALYDIVADTAFVRIMPAG
jgi:uncharacterized RDD family membrane protein YckC